MIGQAGLAMTSIGIIGSGPSALYAFMHLIESPFPLAMTFYEASDNFGFGSPYDPAVNARTMLANIASIELPPLVDPLDDWLRAQPDDVLSSLGVIREEICERAFFPRIAIGAYYAAQAEALRARALERGHDVSFLRNSRIHDVVATADGVRFMASGPDQRLVARHADFAVIATGHGARGETPGRRNQLLRPYPAPELLQEWTRVGVLGSSLSAIDVVVALAFQAGRFVRRDGVLRYVADRALAIVMMSRGGVIPEADFYFPYPYEPLSYCTADALDAMARRDPDALLDAAFEALRRELRTQDPDFAACVRLDELTADSFAAAYFAPWRVGDAFEYAQANLAQAREGFATCAVSRWRYCLLRAHEAFEPLVSRLNARDRDRFEAGLKRVFVHNYAAAPHLSIERLLALRDAAILSLRRLHADYEIAAGESGGFVVADGEGTDRFDAVVDARGQRSLSLRDLPFPSLRMQLLAADGLAAGADGDAEASDFELDFGPWVVGRVLLIAAPYLLDKRPFSQGLTSACAFGEEAAALLLRKIAAARNDPGVADASLERILAHIENSEIIELGCGAVVEAARSSD